MNRYRLTTLAVAVAGFLAVSVAATTLAGAVATDPSAAIDLDYDVLPVDEDEAAELQRQIRSNAADRASPGDGSATGSAARGAIERRDRGDAGRDGASRDETGASAGTEPDGANGQAGERSESSHERAGERSDWTADPTGGPQRPGEDGFPREDFEGEDREAVDPSSPADADAIQRDPDGDVPIVDPSEGGEEGGDDGDDAGFVDSDREDADVVGVAGDDGDGTLDSGGDGRPELGILWWLLGGAAVLRGVLAVGRRIELPRPALRGAAGPARTGSARTLAGGTDPDENAVYRSWAALVGRLDVEDADRLTTGECAAAARRAGMDAEAVATLRRTFEEVRYGDRPVTDTRRRRARSLRQQLGLGDGERA